MRASPSSGPSSHSSPVIQTQGLAKRVISPEGELTILDNVNLSIGAGESVAVVGASGSGKSTLLGLLAGLDTPSAGTVHLDGEPISELDEDARAALRARLVGFVFQAFQLIPSLSALENAMLPLELAGADDAKSRALDVLDRVGLSERVTHYPRQLSGGEQQRVAIARAFASEPRVLFADEPTGNLDHGTGERVTDLLFELNREKATTLVLVTHDSELAGHCSRRFEMTAGKLTEPA